MAVGSGTWAGAVSIPVTARPSTTIPSSWWPRSSSGTTGWRSRRESLLTGGTGWNSLAAGGLGKLVSVTSRNDLPAKIRRFLTTRRAKLTPRARRPPCVWQKPAGTPLTSRQALDLLASSTSTADQPTAVTSDPDT